jgi:hypothetical protein
VRAEGTHRIYGVDTAGLAVVQDWLARFADADAQPLDALETELARGRRERRRTGSPDPAGQPRPATKTSAPGVTA